MAKKKTDWKREAARQTGPLPLPPDGDYSPGTTILKKGTRESVPDPDAAPTNRQELMYLMTRGQWARAESPGPAPAIFPPGAPVISKTMEDRMRGLFGGGEQPRSKRAAGSSRGRD